MAWIVSHQELARHPKTRRLARLLGISVPTAIGHLHLLWWWALDFAQTGDLGRYDAADIADAAVYEGDPDRFVTAMIEAGFVDRLEDGRLQLHDWMDYAGKFIEKRQEDAERKRDMRVAYEAGVIKKVRQRDRDRCRYCGKSVNWADRKGPDGGTYDHVNPALPASAENLVVACRACNARKGKRTPEQAGMRLLPISSGADVPHSDQIPSRPDLDRTQNGPDPDRVESDTNLPTVPVPYPNRTETVPIALGSTTAGTTCTQPPTPTEPDAVAAAADGGEQPNNSGNNSDATSGGPDPDAERVVNCYLATFGKWPSGLIQEDLFEWLERLGPDLLVEAMRRTAAANTRSWRYTDAILRAWTDANVKTVDDVARLDAEHERTKEAQNHARARAQPVSRYVEGNYDWDKLAEG